MAAFWLQFQLHINLSAFFVEMHEMHFFSSLPHSLHQIHHHRQMFFCPPCLCFTGFNYLFHVYKTYNMIISKPSYYHRNSIALNVLTNPNFSRAYFTSMCQSQWPWLASSSSSPQYWVWLAGISVFTGEVFKSRKQQIIWSPIVV